MLPNFLVIGAPRSGTTSLYEYLRAHPDIYMSPVKEPDYFANETPEALERKRPEYEALFDKAREEARRGEASALYLAHPHAPENIRQAIPDARLVVVLRDPVERAYSHFLHAQRIYAEHPDSADDRRSDEAAFLAAVDRAHREGFTRPGRTDAEVWIRSGFYHHDLLRYRSLFPTEQMRIYRFEDLATDPRALTTDLYRFLGVDPDFAVPTDQAFNATVVPKNRSLFRFFTTSNPAMRLARSLAPTRLRALAVRTRNRALGNGKPEIPADLRRKLAAIYRDDTRQLGELLGWDLSSWISATG